MASFEQLVFEIIAKDRNASAAFDRFRRSVDQTSGSLDSNTQSLDKNQKAQVSVLGGLVGLGTASSALITPLAAAGGGFAAFAALAVPSVSKISKAFTGPGGLQANLGTLDAGQKKVALSVQALGQDYSELAKQLEPRVFQVFNTGLAEANKLLGPFDQLAVAGGKGVEDFLAQFTTGSGLGQFIRFLSHEAVPALHLLGEDVTAVAHAVFSLLESFGGLGMAELKAVTGVLTGVSNAISWLAEHAPGVTSAAIALGGLTLALSKFGLLVSVAKLTGISAIAGQMAGFAAATKGATIAEKGLLATTVTLEAITPWGWAIAGAAALGGLIYLTRNYEDGTKSLIDTMAKQDQATGLNVAGYAKLSAALKDVSIRTLEQRGAVVTSEKDMAGFRIAQNELTAAQITASQKAQNLRSDFRTLGSQYGLNTDQVKTLIVKSGSLNDILASNGKITPEVAAKIKAWADTENKATGQTNTMAIAVKTLTDAMNKNITTVLTLQGDELAWRSALQQAKQQLDSNSAGLKGNSANAIANKQAVLGATNAAIAFAKEQLTSKSNLAAASSEITAQIRFLRGLHDQSGFTKEEIKALVSWLRQIKSEQANIRVTGSGSWTVLPSGKHIPGGAKGMRVPGYGGGDRWPALLEGGEAVVPKHLTPAVAPFLKAHGVPGFAAGGVVGSYSDGAPGLTRWLKTENAATLRAMEQSVATAVLQTITAVSGGGSGVARWRPTALQALGLLGLPYQDVGTVLSQIASESGGNPTIVNKWDSNWARGTPSVGLMQVIGPTFAAYAGRFRGTGPFEYGVSVNPLANIYAGINYAIHRYGNPGWLSVLGHGHGYDEGGWLPTGLSLAYNGTGKPERVGGGDVYNIVVNMPPGSDGADVVRALQAYTRRNGPIKLKVRS